MIHQNACDRFSLITCGWLDTADKLRFIKTQKQLASPTSPSPSLRPSLTLLVRRLVLVTVNTVVWEGEFEAALTSQCARSFLLWPFLREKFRRNEASVLLLPRRLEQLHAADFLPFLAGCKKKRRRKEVTRQLPGFRADTEVPPPAVTLRNYATVWRESRAQRS